MSSLSTVLKFIANHHIIMSLGEHVWFFSPNAVGLMPVYSKQQKDTLHFQREIIASSLSANPFSKNLTPSKMKRISIWMQLHNKEELTFFKTWLRTKI